MKLFLGKISTICVQPLINTLRTTTKRRNISQILYPQAISAQFPKTLLLIPPRRGSKFMRTQRTALTAIVPASPTSTAVLTKSRATALATTAGKLSPTSSAPAPATETPSRPPDAVIRIAYRARRDKYAFRAAHGAPSKACPVGARRH
jgi:hypothetical protein